MLAVADLEIVEQLDRARRAPRRRHVAGEMQHHGDILGARQKRQQIVVLEDEADLLQPQPAQVGAQPAAVIDRSGLRGACARDDGSRMQPMTLSSGGLAGAARAAQADHLAGRDLERNVAQRIDAGRSFAEMLANVDRARPGPRLGTRPSSASERRGRVDLEREAHAEPAGEKADDQHDDAERESILRLQQDPSREIVLDRARSGARRTRSRSRPSPAPAARSARRWCGPARRSA